MVLKQAISAALSAASVSAVNIDSNSHPHPVVQGAGNLVNLEVRGNNDYFGPLFVGSFYREERMIYDTAS